MTYDYIIIGAGAAGLQLTVAMGKSSFFDQKSILLIDKDAKKTNDRSWCFWEQGLGSFDVIVHRHWDQVYFAGKSFSQTLAIAPYQYKMVRGIDFYTSLIAQLKTFPNVQFLQETVTEITEDKHSVQLHTAQGIFLGKQVFNSMLSAKPMQLQKKYPVLQQHFLGWFVETTTPVFDAGQATFMDFSIPQKNNTRFMYVLPFSATTALVEYTLFSEHLLAEKEYETAIEAYLKEKYNCESYRILDREKGSIPMTCYNFASQNTQRLMHIGTAGGWTKASTGYTFQNTSKQIRKLIAQMEAGTPRHRPSRKTKFWFYDLILLDVLHQHNDQGQLIFESLFKKRDPRLILKFLDEETTLWEDLLIISACPKRLFITTFFRRLRYTLR
ncbi:lycopene cyclase family protein [Arenibacter sp. GZD96]|uniref:lycopene cyclase family protein n=1 Tax=Aurantibrevibacter litoralis TaxID=3106030 RepID=UPI002AFFC463|nr:lycopene cyclase family protein [Arenibacter sp. GZD-96]MEA1786418.1 lycopene cyclase family protein [Arenibacter sp. GZD-96]